MGYLCCTCSAGWCGGRSGFLSIWSGRKLEWIQISLPFKKLDVFLLLLSEMKWKINRKKILFNIFVQKCIFTKFKFTITYFYFNWNLTNRLTMKVKKTSSIDTSTPLQIHSEPNCTTSQLKNNLWVICCLLFNKIMFFKDLLSNWYLKNGKNCMTSVILTNRYYYYYFFVLLYNS